MRYEYQVDGMRCGHCERALVDAMQELEAVESVEADHRTGRLSVGLSATPPSDWNAIVETIVQGEGFRLVNQAGADT